MNIKTSFIFLSRISIESLKFWEYFLYEINNNKNEIKKDSF